jgi:hypothetical protein
VLELTKNTPFPQLIKTGLSTHELRGIMRFESKSHAGSQYTTAEPEICEYEVSKDDIFLIISSDSVCDVMDTTKKPAHVVIASSCAMEEGKQKIDTDRFKWEARKLYEHARSCGSGDNFSVICVDLKSCGNPASESGVWSLSLVIHFALLNQLHIIPYSFGNASIRGGFLFPINTHNYSTLF